MKRRSKVIVASVIIITLVVVAATLHAAFTRESGDHDLAVKYREPQPHVRARLGQRAASGNLSLRVQSVRDSNDPAVHQLWETYETTKYAPLNPVPRSTYVIVNVSVGNLMNHTLPFRYATLELVGNDERVYYANYAVSNESCNALVAREQLNAGVECDAYIAYSIPDNVAAAKLVYTASDPAIVINLT